MSRQLDLFAPRAPTGPDYSRLICPPAPHRRGDIARLWHGLHPHRTAWFWYDDKWRTWSCIDPFDQHGINDRDEPPIVNEHGRLVEPA